VAKQANRLGTLKELSAALKEPLTTVAGWTKHPLWQWSRKAPWQRTDAPAMLLWAADTLERGRPLKEKADPKTASEIAKLREQKLREEIRKLRAHADQAETALSKERGALHDADACEEEAVHRATLYRNGVQNLPSQVVSLALAGGMPHESAPQFQKQIEELVNGCLRYTAASADKKHKEHDDAGAEGAAAAGAVDAVGVG
jgi:Xaa-Pro aminopeptidase